MSTAVALAVFLPCAPAAMAILYWQGKRAERRRQTRQFAEEVEFYMIVRHRG